MQSFLKLYIQDYCVDKLAKFLIEHVFFLLFLQKYTVHLFLNQFSLTFSFPFLRWPYREALSFRFFLQCNPDYPVCICSRYVSIPMFSSPSSPISLRPRLCMFAACSCFWLHTKKLFVLYVSVLTSIPVYQYWSYICFVNESFSSSFCSYMFIPPHNIAKTSRVCGCFSNLVPSRPQE